MGIRFDNPVSSNRLYPISRESLGMDNTPNKEKVEPGSFLDLFKKASESPEPQGTPPDGLQTALDTQKKVLALTQRMELQMNKSLLQIFSDTDQENPFENSLMEGLRELLSQGRQEVPLLSMIRQTPSEIDQPLIQGTEPIKSKEIKEDRRVDRDGIDGIIQKAADIYGVDSELIRGVIQAESNFNPNAISSKGARGLMQLMPATARELGVTDSLNPVENIMGGTRYLKKLLDRYDGSVPLALAAYNWGMGNLDSHRSRMPAETRNYVAKITGVSIT